jgi:hypothetical protein
MNIFEYLGVELKDILLVSAGAIGSIGIQYLFGIGMLKREGKQRITEKIVDKKIEAYEDMMLTAKSMRKVQRYEGEMPNDFPITEDNDLYRYPELLVTVDNFYNWYTDLITTYHSNGESVIVKKVVVFY